MSTVDEKGQMLLHLVVESRFPQIVMLLFKPRQYCRHYVMKYNISAIGIVGHAYRIIVSCVLVPLA